MKVLVLAPYLYDTAPGQRFRIEQWARALEPQGVRCHFAIFESPELKRVLRVRRRFIPKTGELIRCIGRRLRDLDRLLAQERWDVIFLHRELLPVGPPVLERRLARAGVPIVYDFDDAIFLPDVSDANRRFAWLKWSDKVGAICRMSAQVIVGNPYLEAYARCYTDRVTVIPTTIDTDQYRPQAAAGAQQAVPTIGWSGSLTTIKHLRSIESALRRLHRLRPFRLKVIGDAAFSIDGMPVESVAWSAATELSELSALDIGIMPLPDEPWAWGKCGLKALQYMALGIPTVASPVGVNRQIIRDGVSGCLASSEADWIEQLSTLLADAQLRWRLGQEGRRVVEARYAASVQAPRLMEILEQASGVSSGTSSPALTADVAA